MNFLFKFLFYIKSPKLVLVFGENNDQIIKLISSVLDQKIEKISDKKCGLFNNKVFVTDANFNNDLDKFNFLIKHCCLFVLVLSGDFNNNEIKKIKDLSRLAGRKMFLINESHLSSKIDINKNKNYTIGFEKKSDICISDLKIQDNSNFKINNKGNIVPFWFNKQLKRKEIVIISLAVATMMALDFNLVQISQNINKDL